jgi:hypothetical protein
MNYRSQIAVLSAALFTVCYVMALIFINADEVKAPLAKSSPPVLLLLAPAPKIDAPRPPPSVPVISRGRSQWI